MFSYDFANYGSSTPMIEFLDTLSLKERALIYKNIQKLIEYKSYNFNISEKFASFKKIILEAKMYITVEVNKNENKIIEAIKMLKGVGRVYIDEDDVMTKEDKIAYKEAKKDLQNGVNIVSLDEMLAKNGL